jgi:MoaA/NifB/PqqE/SkfB family radical SAM enzyme
MTQQSDGGRWKTQRASVHDIDRSLDLTGKLFQRSIYPAVRQVADGRRLAAPLVVDLDPTTMCDLACPECISASVLHTSRFSADRCVELAGELVGAGVKAVVLIGGGEPLMHPAVGKVITILHEASLKVGLVTNGTMIGRYLDELASMASWVRVSVDAATQETYDRFRPSRRNASVFPLVIGNMRELAARKTGRLGYSFLLMQRFDDRGRAADSNYGELYQAGELAKDIGCDYFEVKAMLDSDHFTINQPTADIAAAEEQVARLRLLEDDAFRVLSSSNWEAVRRDAHPVQPKEYASCAVAELRTTVTPNGVYICPYHRGDERGRLGEVTTTSFGQMWASADTTIIDPRRDCPFFCARHEANLAIGRLGAGSGAGAGPHDGAGTEPELTDDFDAFL